MRTTLLIACLAILPATACKKKSGTTDTGTLDTAPRSPAGGSAKNVSANSKGGSATATDDDGNQSFAAVYFEFDSSVIDEAGRQDLQQLADWMGAHGGAVITLEGHADERGTDEYNIALGQRRAQAMHDYLVRLGVAAKRINTISYGEERPAVAGSSESAYAKNRRGEIVPQR
ncbi:MAG: peptidoglycan-associated lipoprotein Pal [Kofleriaceae bacterium]|nr:peptidoglycan-associated lipoprotein Pal [Myxococcales bacterium]MCB9560237.1 peptidoglycan-associated lipoprotein Pal [Kofleriaceae bacterium]MCB9571198.1 peptidoglycan-associated lipoprotein Pal [Kofleriaceae bacterium]